VVAAARRYLDADRTALAIAGPPLALGEGGRA
jgi:hypothetical protein